MSLAKPRHVLLRCKGGECCAKFLDGFKVVHPEELLFEGPYRPLGHAICFRLPDECRRRHHAKASDIVMEIFRHVI